VTCPLVTPKERRSWRVVLPRDARARAFLRGLPAGRGARRRIGPVAPVRTETTLTRRQDRALRLAFELGYFDYPRRATLGDVARSLGGGRSSTLEVLRRATAKLAGRRYGDELSVRAAA
jgi:predicted DNA binding protein